MICQKMDSLSFELLSRMAHMMTRMTRMTHWLDSHDSLARSLSRPYQVACQMLVWLSKIKYCSLITGLRASGMF